MRLVRRMKCYWCGHQHKDWKENLGTTACHLCERSLTEWGQSEGKRGECLVTTLERATLYLHHMNQSIGFLSSNSHLCIATSQCCVKGEEKRNELPWPSHASSPTPQAPSSCVALKGWTGTKQVQFTLRLGFGCPQECPLGGFAQWLFPSFFFYLNEGKTEPLRMHHL